METNHNERKIMDINQLTQFLQMFQKMNQSNNNTSNDNNHPYQIGKNYLVRTVTHYHIGRLEAVYPQELVLGDDSWVADTGRYNKAIKEGKDALQEVELSNGPAIIGRGALVDAVLWDHELPNEVK